VGRIDDPNIAQRKRERLRATWRETLALDHPKAHAVRRYLQARALGKILCAPPKVLRAHRALEYWHDTQSFGCYPAMVALFHGAAGAPATLHITYLRSDGCAKASVPAPKKILGVPERGATRGGAVRLFDARGGVLGVAEGIESALSLHLIRNIPVWASFCADNLERIRLPTGLRELQIGVDLDASGKGEAVAKALAERVMRWSPRTRVLYVKPELDGPGDLNDELRRLAG
jgi:putative DNA primase/helicase